MGRLVQEFEQVLVDGLLVIVRLNQHRAGTEVQRAVELAVLRVTSVIAAHLRSKLTDVLFSLLEVKQIKLALVAVS